MNKEAAIAQKLLTGLALTGAAGAAGYGGFKVGHNTGAKKAVNEMTSAFYEANQKENKGIVDRFNTFNKVENRAIMNQGLKRGFEIGRAKASGKSMNKKAALDYIYKEAFNDELEKLAIPTGLIAKGVKTLGKSFKNLGKGLAHQGGHASKITTTKSLAGLKQRVGYMGKSALTSAKKSKAALGTVGGAAATTYALS